MLAVTMWMLAVLAASACFAVWTLSRRVGVLERCVLQLLKNNTSRLNQELETLAETFVDQYPPPRGPRS